jgi:dolichyl-phosphate-mannose-protein mannosyltransferase
MYGEKESVASLGMPIGGEEKDLMLDDGDSGKWGKGYGVGPGYGGRRGLPPMQKRIPGWVGCARSQSCSLQLHEAE